jgi:hypothetical protein
MRHSSMSVNSLIVQGSVSAASEEQERQMKQCKIKSERNED